jgi:MFS family permease
VLMPSFTAMGILCLLLAVAAPGIQLGLVVSAIGLFFYTLINIANAATMDVAGDHIQGSSFGLTSLVNQIVVFPTPLVAGYLVERQGILSAFWLAGIFLLLGAVVLIPLKLYKGTRKS